MRFMTHVQVSSVPPEYLSRPPCIPLIVPVISTVESAANPVIGAVLRRDGPLTGAVNGIVGAVDSVADTVEGTLTQ
ncbi:uncharacterized protein STEHIDRAFT_149621 [Stereum hirsutum FP-91666 SS1]|uniref:uncharacterized protein n=1 Tax=Stereum hirsutum (strain FP-91666) TaxID=721885 RepID=UPI0004449368|nr:uncharacterized protein STEHIDRAFT_149621 [Stereum hirsutum FP-91666 SS1]EIM81845.1 hypothetical protein STEHIDRAFT_149621 [Stereum hirsutum FP-91666 SS1]